MKKLNVTFSSSDLKEFTDYCRANKIKWDIQERQNKTYTGVIKYETDLQIARFVYSLGLGVVSITLSEIQ